MRFRNLLVAGVAVVALNAQAPAQSITGKWLVKYPGRVQNVNGHITADTATALLSIEIRGDSVFGSWRSQNTPVSAPARAITGTFKDGTLRFTGGLVEARIRRGGGEEEAVQMHTFYEAKLNGNELVGTMHSESVDGSIHTENMAWSAQRTL